MLLVPCGLKSGSWGQSEELVRNLVLRVGTCDPKTCHPSLCSLKIRCTTWLFPSR